MSRKKPSQKRLGIPRGLPAELRAALADELQRMGTTYEEVAYASHPPLTPDKVLTLVRAWNSLTPAQKAKWDAAARQENMRGAYTPFTN